MLQSQIINVLPRRILAGLWATQETRISLSHLTAPVISSPTSGSQPQQQPPAATSASFLCTELPVRYTHILRLLSTLSHDSLQSPIIRNVAHSYLKDICTLLHPSLKDTSPKAFSNVLSRLRSSQATNLIRLKYALLSSPTSASAATLMENINTIGFGIHLLLDQHLSWNTTRKNHAQKVCLKEIANQAVQDAQKAFSNSFGSDTPIPTIEIRKDTFVKNNKQQKEEQDFIYIPSVLHRVLYESSLLSLRAQALHDQDMHRQSTWLQRTLGKAKSRPLSLRIFGGPTSIGFRLDAAAPLIETDLLPGIPRDPLGIPSCGSILSRTSATTVDHHSNQFEGVEWESLSGWRSAKALASHWGGNLDAVTVEGLGSTIYLALDRDVSLLERYPSRHALASSAHSLLRHHRRTSAISASLMDSSALSIQAAATQLDAFLYAISDSQQSTFSNPTPLYHHHSVSLSAAVGHA